MSIYVDEIVLDIKENPLNWTSKNKGCIFNLNKEIDLSGYGNTKILSVVNCKIRDKEMPTTWSDGWKLESVIGWWFKNSTIEMNTD